MAQLTQPLGLRRFLTSQPKSGFDLLPFFDVILIALIVALNSSRFVNSPGATINLVRMQETLSSVPAPKAVLTVDQNELFFFGGQKIANAALAEVLDNYVNKLTDTRPELLIKADASISTESLFRLFETAKKAGFTSVHLAAEEEYSSVLKNWSELNSQ